MYCSAARAGPVVRWVGQGVHACANAFDVHVLVLAEVVDDVGAQSGEDGVGEVAGVDGGTCGMDPGGEFVDPEPAGGVGVVGVRAVVLQCADERAVLYDEVQQRVEIGVQACGGVPSGPERAKRVYSFS